MKRVLTIGRDDSCDIHINDNTDVVSRHHAIVEVGRFGKYYIVDQSRNGTYVNGSRIPTQQKHALRRGDEVSLAHTAILDWEQVPKDNTLLHIIIGVVSALILIAAIIVGVTYLDGKPSSSSTDVEWVSGENEDINPSNTTPIDGDNSEGETTEDGDAQDDSSEDEDAPKEDTTPKQDKPKNNKKAETSKEPEKAIVDAIY